MKKFRTVFLLILLGTCLSLSALLFSNSTFQTLKTNIRLASTGNSSEYEFGTVLIEDCTVISSTDLEVNVGQQIKLSVQTVPSYAVFTARNISYEIINGNKYASIVDDTLIISETANIGVEVSVIAIVEGKESSNILTFTVVPIAVQKIEILNLEDSIQEGCSLILNSLVLPNNASNKEIAYTIISGSQYATIWADGTIKVNNKLPFGNLKIVVRAQSKSNEEIYVDKEFSLYVPTNKITLTADNLNPNAGENVELLQTYSSTASSDSPEYIIQEGSEYIDSFVGNSLKIKSIISVENPQIKLCCIRDCCISNSILINIIIPIEELIISSNKNIINQGESIKLDVTTVPSNATKQGLMFQIISGTEGTITADGYLTALSGSNENATVKVIAKSNNVTSDEYEITIKKPDFNLFSNINNPTIDSVNGAEVELSVSHSIPKASTPIYEIVKGEEYGEVIGNVLHIYSGIKNDNPQITVRAQIGEFQSNDLIIDVKILAEEIVFAEGCVDEVEQRRSYIFKANILPTNATLVNADISYTLNVDDTIATISEFGVLEISENAPIGTVITITANGPDGVSASHNVTVKPVYAKTISIYETKNKIVVRPGSVLNFDAIFSGSDNISECVKQYSLRIDGCSIASVDDKTVTVCSIEQITQNNPRFSVVAVSTQGNITITDEWEVEVYIPVVDIQLLQKVGEVDEGKTVSISDLLNTQIYPKNANTKSVKYSIASGNEYAKIINNEELVISNNLPNGNLTCTLCATAEGVTSNTVTFVMYVATKTLAVEVDNVNPMSLIAYGEKVNIHTSVDSRATNKSPNITVTHGADLIDNLTADGFDVKPNLRSIENLDKRITLEIERDGIIKIINVVVYIPVEELVFVARSVTRGTSENLVDVIHNANDDYCGFEILGITDGCALSMTMPMKLRVPQYFNAGTPIVVSYKSLDRLGKEFSTTLYVDAFTQEDLTKFTRDFGCDSNGILISSTSPQLASGLSANIELSYQCEPLATYGLEIQDLLVNDSGVVRLNENDKINVLAGNDGKSTIDVDVIIKDGEFIYFVELPRIAIFNPVDFSQLDFNITTAEEGKIQVGDIVAIAGWDERWTVNKDDLVWENIETETLSNNLAITDKAPCQNFAIKINLTNKQKYNGQNWEIITKQDSIKQFNFTGIEYRDSNNKVLKRTWKKYVPGITTQIALEGQLIETSNIYVSVQTQWVDEINNRYNIYYDSRTGNTYGENYFENTSLILKPHFSNVSETINLLEGEHVVSRDWYRSDWKKINLELQLLKNLGYNEVQFYWTHNRKENNSETLSHIRLDYRYNDNGESIGFYNEYTHGVTSKDSYKMDWFTFYKTCDELIQNGLWIRGCYIDEKKNSWEEGKILWLFGGHTVYAEYTVAESELRVSVERERGGESGGTASYAKTKIRPIGAELRPAVI